MRKEIIAVPGEKPSKKLSRVVKFGNLVFVAGTTGRNPVSRELAGEDIASQGRQALENIRTALQAAGASMDDVLKITCYLVDEADKKAFDEVYVEFFPKDPPVRAAVEVAALSPGVRVEIETIAGIPD